MVHHQRMIPGRVWSQVTLPCSSHMELHEFVCEGCLCCGMPAWTLKPQIGVGPYVFEGGCWAQTLPPRIWVGQEGGARWGGTSHLAYPELDGLRGVVWGWGLGPSQHALECLESYFVLFEPWHTRDMFLERKMFRKHSMLAHIE